MKAGDLVTLSAYSRKLVYVSSYLARRHYQRHGASFDVEVNKPLIGLITKVHRAGDDPGRPWIRHDRYKVAWVDKDDAPPGRDHYESHFLRRDLKMVSKA